MSVLSGSYIVLVAGDFAPSINLHLKIQISHILLEW